MGISELARMCRRLSTSLEAGLNLRTVWAREVDRARGLRAKWRIQAVAEALERGEGMREALGYADGLFPELFIELAEIGDQTGHLGEAFEQLAVHYERQIQIRRNFLAAIAWPVIQLVASLAVVGFLIWILGAIGRSERGQIDPLGLGLFGNKGLFIYVMFLLIVAVALYALYEAMRRGVLWTRPIQRLLLQIPGLGGALRTLALARMAWVLHLALDAGMDVRRAISLSVSSTRNDYYISHTREVRDYVAQGGSLYEALAHTGCYPAEFLDVVQVGESSGRLVESLALLSKQYHDRADSALKTLGVIGGFAVWAVIAAFIITLIFRMAFFYFNTIRDLSK